MWNVGRAIEGEFFAGDGTIITIELSPRLEAASCKWCNNAFFQEVYVGAST
jgi:hypothetical protein